MSAVGRFESALSPWRVVRFDEIDSTNEEARRRALAADAGRLWIVAEKQSAGRGRRGRSWVSPKGNVYASALLIEPCRAEIAPQLGFVAGVALARAAEDLGAARARLKWPNDLMSGKANKSHERPTRRFLAHSTIADARAIPGSPGSIAYSTALAASDIFQGVFSLFRTEHHQ